MSIKIFFCYAREDEVLLEKLKTHLRPLQRQGLIEFWYDRDISVGTEWEHEIDQQLNSADIVLLFISSDFMNSDYCYSVEMQRALERHKRGEARVIPIILRHVYWQGEPLGKLQALPKDGMPVMGPFWHNLDMAFYNVVEGIREVVEKLSVSPLVKLPEPVSAPPFSDSLDKGVADKKVLIGNPSDRVVATTSNRIGDASNRVLVVAARNALSIYLRCSAYICQPNRAFQDCVRLAFYANHCIDRRVPKIGEQIEAISKEEIETREDLTDLTRERLRDLYKNLEGLEMYDGPRKYDWNVEAKIIFLSSPESPETLILPHDVANNLTADSGRGIAFTQGQRYISLSRLEKGPKTTSELV